MAKYTVCFMATGGITVEADSYDEAYDKFGDISSSEIMAELALNGYEVTEILCEEGGE